MFCELGEVVQVVSDSKISRFSGLRTSKGANLETSKRKLQEATIFAVVDVFDFGPSFKLLQYLAQDRCVAGGNQVQDTPPLGLPTLEWTIMDQSTGGWESLILELKMWRN